jgi:hypothetical protein
VTTATEARRRRMAAAAKYKPETVELLLIAEAPPSSLERYFYFEHVSDHDSLFRHVVSAVLGIEPSRSQKRGQLRELASRGVFLIDLKPDPKEPGERLQAHVPDLVARAIALNPRHVVAIKANVCELLQAPLRAAGLHVAAERVPFPGSGQQRRFRERMADALESIGWPTPVWAQAKHPNVG